MTLTSFKSSDEILSSPIIHIDIFMSFIIFVFSVCSYIERTIPYRMRDNSYYNILYLHPLQLLAHENDICVRIICQKKEMQLTNIDENFCFTYFSSYFLSTSNTVSRSTQGIDCERTVLTTSVRYTSVY